MISKTRIRGITSILTMFFVILFAVLSVSFASVSNKNLTMSRNHRNIIRAQVAANSGLQYAHSFKNILPVGINSKYLLTRNGDSYYEY